MSEIATALLWIVGSAFAFLAALGVVRMPDVFTRMQASTKASTLGLGCLLLGSALQLADLASIIRLVSIAVIGCLMLRPAFAIPAPMSEGDLLSKSDLVALVRILSVTCTSVSKDERTGEELPSYVAKAELIEVLKGDELKGDDFRLCIPLAEKGKAFENKRPEDFDTKGKFVALFKAKRAVR